MNIKYAIILTQDLWQASSSFTCLEIGINTHTPVLVCMQIQMCKIKKTFVKSSF